MESLQAERGKVTGIQGRGESVGNAIVAETRDAIRRSAKTAGYMPRLPKRDRSSKRQRFGRRAEATVIQNAKKLK